MSKHFDSLVLVLALSLLSSLLMAWLVMPSRAETARNVASIIQSK